MIDIATLKEYIKVLEESSLKSIEISDDDNKIRLEKAVAEVAVQTAQVSVPAAAAPAAPAPADVPKNSGKAIKAPIVGVFYAAPSPDSDPYVYVGKKVKKGETVCIIEAMKCMNEIQAEADGEIAEVLVNNGDLVEYEQPLFSLR